MARPLLKRPRRRVARVGGKGVFGLPPPAVLALLYAGLIVLGALALKLPAAHTQPLSWGDALFTACSAVTVTGLVVVDTGTAFTALGQGVILALIQLGGLGLMVFAVMVLSALGLPIGLSQSMVLREDLNRTSLSDLALCVKMILRVVILAEVVGAALLAFVFVPELGWSAGLWAALFHSISAFNNAGFALWPDGLSGWVADPLVNLVVPALFIVGGIGFAVISELWSIRRWHRLSLHSKLTLAGTGGLLAVSTLLFALLEWRNPGTLGALDSTWARLQAAWFQAATTRTAGFNTVDIGATHDSTALLVMVLMMIGGGSTSTAGGIKITTFIVLLLATVAFFRRREELDAFGRSIPLDQVLKVMALVTISGLSVTTAIFVMSLSHDGEFLDMAFEAASAFGTTGLSRGATGDLDALGRTVIMVLMFMGRVGPLTLGFMLSMRMPPRVRYPREQVFLG
ncbi:MAG: Ktr system potassium transporter B [Rhodobacteraceae bacterium]|nr:Ktr system potassium transporter B [Paracoccaceae bacterium]